jgi:hypothetical protein
MTQDNQVEPELLGRTPRMVKQRVRLDGPNIASTYIGPILMAMIGLWATIYTTGASLVSPCGRAVPAQVLSIDSEGDDGDATYRAYLEYRVNGIIYTSSSIISFQEMVRLHGVETVTIKVLRQFPDFAPDIILADKARCGRLNLFWFMTLIWDVAVLGALNMTIGARVTRRRILANGTPTLAEIVDKPATTNEDVTMYSLRYRFTTSPANDGEVISANVGVSEEQWRSVDIGDKLTVLYLPKNPKSNELYRFSPFIVTSV